MLVDKREKGEVGEDISEVDSDGGGGSVKKKNETARS